MVTRDSEAATRSGAVRRRRARSVRVAPRAPAYLTRRIPYFEFASEEALEKIENQAEWLMQEIGIEFRDDPEALHIWKRAGADVDGVNVRLPRGMARELCKTIPPVFTQHARNPARSVRIGGPFSVFAPNYGSPFILDLDEGRRYGTLSDLQNLIKVSSSNAYLHHSGGIIVEPCDIPVNKRHLEIVYSHIKLSEKPYLGMITAKDRAEDSVALTRILFGEEFVDQNCCVLANVNANSPLMFDKVATEAIRVYSAANQAMIVAPFILSGAMGPVSTAASIAQALAEGMAAGAFTQLIRKGAPFVLGNFLSSMSLKSGAPTFGMPEPVMSNYVVGQLARRLNMPLRCGGSLTASKVCDAQAAFESADSMHATALGGANFVMHAAGWLEGGLTVSCEKLIIDADRLGAYQTLLAGMGTDENDFATEAYLEVPHGSHFLGCSHTMANYESAFYDATMSDSESFEQWTENGAMDAAARANRVFKKTLAEFESPPLDEATDEALREFIDRKKASLADAWY